MVCAANRSLEDMDEYYRSNPPLIVTKDPDAIRRRRPQKYIQREEEEIERAAAAVEKRALSVGAVEHAEWTSEIGDKH